MDFPNLKALLYVLTFLGCAYSSDGLRASYNLNNDVQPAETVFSNLYQAVAKVRNQFQDVHEVFSTAVQEYCVFTCQKKDLKTIPRSDHLPSSNGCGTLGVKIDIHHLPVRAITRCCNAHDLCYDTCNADKENCDFEFKRCLYKLCNEMDKFPKAILLTGCKTAAKVFFTGVQALGCKAYLDSQRTACTCVPDAENEYQAD